MVHRKSDVAVARPRRAAAVHTHPHLDRRLARPLRRLELALGVDRRRDRVPGFPEGRKELVAAEIDDFAAMSFDRAADHLPVLLQELGVRFAEPLQQARRALDVREEEGQLARHRREAIPRGLPQGRREEMRFLRQPLVVLLWITRWRTKSPL